GLDRTPGSFGYRLTDSESTAKGTAGSRSAGVAYMGDYARAEVTANQSRGNVSGTASLDGAIVVAGGGVFLSNRIDDAFAVVDVGVPNVDVFSENRPV